MVSFVFPNFTPILNKFSRTSRLNGHTVATFANLNHIPAICSVNPDDNKIKVAANGIV